MTINYNNLEMEPHSHTGHNRKKHIDFYVKNPA
jgi:hypothetical protein